MKSLSLKQMIADLERAGKTQTEICEESGIAQSSISKIKNGKQRFVFNDKADALRCMHRSIVHEKAPSHH